MSFPKKPRLEEPPATASPPRPSHSPQPPPADARAQPNPDGQSPADVLRTVAQALLERGHHARVAREELGTGEVTYTLFVPENQIRLLVGVKGRTVTLLRSLASILERAYSGRKATLVLDGDHSAKRLGTAQAQANGVNAAVVERIRRRL